MPKTRGRKLKLNTELIAKIEKLLKAGNYAVTVCNYLGFSEESYYGWKNEAARIKEEYENNPQKKLTKRDRIFLEFLECIKRAEAESEARNVALIQKAAVDNWQAAMTFLERRHPKRWGRKDRLEAELSGKGGNELKIQFEMIDPKKPVEDKEDKEDK